MGAIPQKKSQLVNIILDYFTVLVLGHEQMSLISLTFECNFNIRYLAHTQLLSL